MWIYAFTLIGCLLKLPTTNGASPIRVVNGDSSCSGRVEVYHNGQWGTVCDDNWDINDAQVVCRQLRCGQAVSAPVKAHFGEGSGTTWLDNVGCTGTESSITQCQHPGFGNEDCTASEDAGVVCSGADLIRVVNGDNSCSGRVEVYHNGEWGTVCDDGWDINDAQVVCRQLGCGQAVSAPVQAHFGQGSGTTWLDGVGCTGTESSITECQHQGFGNEDCTASEDAGVVCASTTPIRVVNGDSCSGRVEVYHNGQWGTVCDDNWDINDAQVVCRQLGCGQAVSAPVQAHFGQGSGKIWLDNVGCTGTEISITQCQHPGFGNEDCAAYEDAGVVCAGNMETPTLTLLTANTALFPGESAEFRCTITSQRPLTANFKLYRNGITRQTAVTGTMTVTFSLSSLASSDEGSYTCDYNYQGEHTVSSPQSNAITITVVSLIKPEISAMTREVIMGQALNILCAISTKYTGGIFTLRKVSGSFNERKSSTSATFTIHRADLSHEGSYYCQYQTTVLNREFTSPQSNTISFSVVVNLHQPHINCTAPEGGLSWGPGGPQITRGHSFIITCSTQPQHPGGVFHLSFSGSNITTTQPAVNHSASFYFPAADYSHQGNYSCVYQVELSSRQFFSMETEMLTVTIQEFLVPFIAAGVVGGVLLLLLFGLVYIFCTKTRQTSTRRITWKHTSGPSTMNTYGNKRLKQSEQKKGEDEDEEDYINIDPKEVEGNYENFEMEDQDEDVYANVEMEDPADNENGKVEDEDDYENAEDYTIVEEHKTEDQDENIYANSSY